MKSVIIEKRDGQVTTDVELDYLFSTLRNGRYELTIKRTSDKRSISQNDLMWMWLTCIEQETGAPKEDVYFYYCKKFLSKMVIIGDKLEYIYKTSSKLKTLEMANFLDKIQADAATELGIRLPDPHDKYFAAFESEYA